MAKRKVVLSWSSGKDSAFTLYRLQNDPEVELVGLLTSFNQQADRVAMHAVRRELVKQQAAAAGLPLFAVDLPWPCPNDVYEKTMIDAVADISQQVEFDTVAFGDLFLEDIRAYRERQASDWHAEPIFPLWLEDTNSLAQAMVDSGMQAILTCVDPKQCPAEFAGRLFDQSLLDELPESVDRCGENGEFHTFVFAGPMLSAPLNVRVGETVTRDGFVYADVLPA